MSMGPFKHFAHKGQRYTRCLGCGMVGHEGWTHMHNKDVDGHEYGVNWYRSVAELEHQLKKNTLPPGTIVRGARG